jgi:hypothetical protein
LQLTHDKTSFLTIVFDTGKTHHIESEPATIVIAEEYGDSGQLSKDESDRAETGRHWR